MSAPKSAPSAALVAIAAVAVSTFVIAFLYIGREILIPLALAALLAFLIAPLVTRLERWIGRIAAVVLTVLVLVGIVGGVGWVLTRQVLDLISRLPDYKVNIQTKLRSLKLPADERFTRFSQTLSELEKDLPQVPLAATNDNNAEPVSPPEGSAEAMKKSGEPAPPMAVRVVPSKPSNPILLLGSQLSPILVPLGTTALVLLLLFCMLIQREDLRGRAMRLMGGGRISATTRGIDDAAKRVARYLLMQLIVNATYGLVIWVGLAFIGVPGAFVWGVLAMVLRFVPYVGPWIAAAFPITLSLAVTSGWTMPLLTIGLFIVLELLSNNVMEPWLYGSSTGVSPIALIIAAVFWTWLWGAAGLVLATPLTVCLVVIGRHVPRLGMLSVLLSDEDPLEPHEEFYHRLLTPNPNDAADFTNVYLKTNPKLALYDSVFLPALCAIELDHTNEELETEQHAKVLEEFRELTEDIGARPVPALPTPSDSTDEPENAEVVKAEASEGPAPTCRVLCLPVRSLRDELAGAMLAQLLNDKDYAVTNLPAEMTTGELLEKVDETEAEVVCVSVVSPSTVIHARYLCGKLRARFPKMRLLVGLWGSADGITEATERLRETGADDISTTFDDAIAQLSKHACVLAQEALLESPAGDETERLAQLAELNLLDGAEVPAFDRITRKLAHILNVPMAMITLVDKDRQFFVSQVGLPQDLACARETPRDVSLCSHVVARGEALVVEDLFRDRRFTKNTLVRERKLRFYAGTPLRLPSGLIVGALCVLDIKPRQFSDRDRRLLEVMADEVMEVIGARSTRVAELAVSA